eukprot:scaffold8203_cov135-Isochrysis_galbana.AAC.2
MLTILLSHALGAAGGVRLSLENSNVSCLTEILSSGAPMPPSVYSLGGLSILSDEWDAAIGHPGRTQSV